MLRPDTYVGSVEADEQEIWTVDEENNRMIEKRIKFVPALHKVMFVIVCECVAKTHTKLKKRFGFLCFLIICESKIFDEILVNAADNKQRDPRGMDTIRVDIDKETGRISVYNNGKGIPIKTHKEHNVYVPELIFGMLLTSSNYDVLFFCVFF